MFESLYQDETITPKLARLRLFFKLKNKFKNPFTDNFYHDMINGKLLAMNRALELIINDNGLRSYIFNFKPYLSVSDINKLVDTVYTNCNDVFDNDFNIRRESENLLKQLSDIFEENIKSEDDWEAYLLKVINIYNQAVVRLVERCIELNEEHEEYEEALIYLLGQLTNREVVESVVG